MCNLTRNNPQRDETLGRESGSTQQVQTTAYKTFVTSRDRFDTTQLLSQSQLWL